MLLQRSGERTNREYLGAAHPEARNLAHFHGLERTTRSNAVFARQSRRGFVGVCPSGAQHAPAGPGRRRRLRPAGAETVSGCRGGSSNRASLGPWRRGLPPLRRLLPCAGDSQILRRLCLRTQPPWCTVAGCRLHFHHAELLLSFRTHAQGLATLLMHQQQLHHRCLVSWRIPRASDTPAACLLAMCAPARL